MLADKINAAFGRDKDLRVLFFFDPQGNEKEEVLKLDFDDIKVEIFNGRWLDYKIKFSKEWRDEKVFFYFEQPSPRSRDQMLDFQLLDLLCANRELALDDVEEFMTEYRLQPHQQSLVNKYKRELARSQVISVIKPILDAARFEEKALQQGILSALLNFSKIEDWNTLIIRLLTYTLPNKQKNLSTIFKKFQQVPLIDELNRHIGNIFETNLSENDETEVANLLKRLKYNLITQAFPAHDADPYKELKIMDTRHLQEMNMFYERAINDSLLNKSFMEAFEIHGKAIQADKVVSLYGYDAEYIYQTDDLIWEILRKVTATDFAPSDVIKDRLNSLRTTYNADNLLVNCISFLKDTHQLLTDIEGTKELTFDIPEEYIKRYTESLYLIDTYYRKATLKYQILNMQQTPIDSALEGLKKRIDRSYYNFTFKLNDEWLKCLNDHDFEYKDIRYEKQFDFYNNKIAPLQQKVAVVISDALRYENAAELLRELHSDDKNISTLSIQLSSIPSNTKFGMANLLPAKTWVYNEGEIFLNGGKVVTTEQREKILKERKEDSRAVLFEQISDNDREQNRELFKSSVVYVYHNVIDKTGHSGVERDTFKAVQTAIGELTKLVKQIINNFNVTKVFITSDHGFLYNDYDISEADKNLMEDNEIVESDARDYITKSHDPVSIGYKIPLFSVSKYQEPYYVVIPDSVNRFKKAGACYRFTHGGGSLQEVVLPVIECMREEERVQRKVDMQIVTTDKELKVVSNMLRLTVIQSSPVSAEAKERVVEIGIYDNDLPVSKIATLHLNSTDPKPTNRAHNVSLVLNSKTTSTILKLKVYDVEDRLNPLIEQNITNHTLMARDF